VIFYAEQEEIVRYVMFFSCFYHTSLYVCRTSRDIDKFQTMLYQQLNNMR